MTATDPLDEDLFAGREPEEGQAQALLEQYKLFVNTSEALVQRRRGVNTFFLSVNSLLLAAAGLIARDGSLGGVESLILISLSVSGGVPCLVWRSLISSFRQLSTGKFKVIHALEQRLPARIFSAEWVALGEGKDSVPRDNPVHNADSDRLFQAAIYLRIDPSHVVICPTGMYANYSKWIRKELAGAKAKRKLILGVDPWGQKRRSSVVGGAARETVGWNGKSVVEGIWRCFLETGY